MVATEDRTALHGLEERLFKLVSKKATSSQWAEWLRAPLEHAVAEGDKDLALSLLKAGANGGAGWKGCDGRTLLDAAAEGGNGEVVASLLQAGSSTDLNAVSGPKEMTPLLRACDGGHTAAAYTLFVEGADVRLADSDQRSALHCALQGGHQELANHVLVAGGDVHAKDYAGDTPLHLAAATADDKLIDTLLRRGTGVDIANSKGQRALHIAVERHRISSAEALLKAGADPNARYTGASVSHKCSPLYLARRNSAMTKVLLLHGADVKAQDTLGYTALHVAANWGTPEVVEALVEGGADLEARSYCILFYSSHEFDGLTPVHAAAFNSIQILAALLHKGANVNVNDANGLTPLHVVCKASAKIAAALKMADFLLRRGADETITDNDGNTPKDLIDFGADQAESLYRLLANAPADRTWRRRGMLVLCRARSMKVLGDVGDGKAVKALCQVKGVGSSATAAAGGCLCVLARTVGLEVEEVFRSIVRFL